MGWHLKKMILGWQLLRVTDDFNLWLRTPYLMSGHRLGPDVLGLRNTSRQITGPSILFPLICILFPSVYCFISCQFPSHCNSGKMRWPIFAAMILQCDKSMQFWSDPLKSSFAYCWNRVTVKIWSQYLQYLQSYLEIFISHLAAAVPLLETDNISPVCRYII